jgi:hypothetical protein
MAEFEAVQKQQQDTSFVDCAACGDLDGVVLRLDSATPSIRPAAEAHFDFSATADT